MDIDRYLPAARFVTEAIPGILDQLGLKPFISRIVLTETEQGAAWLFIVLEVNHQEYVEDYATPEVLDYLSKTLHGLPVVFSNSYGLRYAVLLSSQNLLTN